MEDKENRPRSSKGTSSSSKAGLPKFHEKLIKASDGVWDLFVALEAELPKLEFPTLVILGDENIGKSTLLERFVGMRLLPRSRRVTTRCPVEIKLVHNASMSSKDPMRLAVGTSPDDLSPMKAPEVLSFLQSHFDEVESSSESGYSSKVVIVEIQGSTLPNLTLVDLPGLRATPPGAHEATHALASDFLRKPHTLVLAVVSATNQSPASSLSLRLLDQYSSKKDKVLFALTQIDKITPGDMQCQVLEPLLGQVEITTLSTKYGFYGTASLTDKADKRGSIEFMDSAEVGYFDSVMKETTADVADRVGLGNLQNAVVDMFLDYVKAVWAPGTLSFMKNDLKAKIEKQIEALGEDVASLAPKAREEWVVKNYKRVLREICCVLQAAENDGRLAKLLPNIGDGKPHNARRFEMEFGRGGVNDMMTEMSRRSKRVTAICESIAIGSFARTILQKAVVEGCMALNPYEGLCMKLEEWMSTFLRSIRSKFVGAVKKQCLPVASVKLNDVIKVTVIGPLMHHCFRLWESDLSEFMEGTDLAELLLDDVNKPERDRLYATLEELTKAIDVMERFLDIDELTEYQIRLDKLLGQLE